MAPAGPSVVATIAVSAAALVVCGHALDNGLAKTPQVRIA
jgi:hypothetical protein